MYHIYVRYRDPLAASKYGDEWVQTVSTKEQARQITERLARTVADCEFFVVSEEKLEAQYESVLW